MRRTTKRGVLIGLQLCALEIASFTAGVVLQKSGRMFSPPKDPGGSASLSYAEYLARRDPLLGWPSPSEFGGERFDASGARRLPGISDDAPTLISLYGDSFTFGSEVSDEQAWGRLLAQQSGCRVANYGVGGYGTDQAFLRFRQNTEDDATVVVLGHLSENVLRNLSRNRDLLNATRFYALKPRFVLAAAGGLELVALPGLDEEEYLRSVGLRSPFLPVEHENFQVGGPSGAVDLEFPFTLSVVRNLGFFRMRAWMQSKPDHAAFYELGHPLHGTEITLRICAAFAREAELRGKHSLALLLPTRADLHCQRATGRWSYANLVDGLRETNAEFLDFGPRLVREIGQGDVDALFMPHGHYAPQVNVLLADFVREQIAARGWLDSDR